MLVYGGVYGVYIYIYILAWTRQYPLPDLVATVLVDVGRAQDRRRFRKLFSILFSATLARLGCPSAGIAWITFDKSAPLGLNLSGRAEIIR